MQCCIALVQSRGMFMKRFTLHICQENGCIEAYTHDQVKGYIGKLLRGWMICKTKGLVLRQKRRVYQNDIIFSLPRQVSRRQSRNDPQHAVVNARLHEVDRNHSRRWDAEDAVQTQVEYGGVKRKGRRPMSSRSLSSFCRCVCPLALEE